MHRNAVYRVIGGLVFLAIVIGIYVWGEERGPMDIETRSGGSEVLSPAK